MKEPNMDAKKNFVRGWFPVCFDTGENMADCLKQLDELIASALSEAESENRKLKEEVDARRSESCEWLCEMCNVIHPTQAKGFVQECPVCKNAMTPTSQNLREIKSLQSKLGEARKIMEFMASFSPHCCEDCPCDEFRRKAAEFLEPPDEGKGTKEILDDGFGNQWSAVCPTCKEPNMQIVRPGKVQCPKCG